MWPDHEADSSELPGADVRSALESWRSGLVDLTGTNPLLNFARVASGAVEITGPAPKAIVKVLQEGGGFCGQRTESQDLNLGSYDGIRLRVRGDGQTYKLNLKTVSVCCKSACTCFLLLRSQVGLPEESLITILTLTLCSDIISRCHNV